MPARSLAYILYDFQVKTLSMNAMQVQDVYCLYRGYNQVYMSEEGILPIILLQNNFIMASQETAQQISKLTFFLEKLTGQFDKYFKHKRGTISEYSENEQRKKERHEQASHQSLASPKEEQPNASSPKRPNPRENTTIEVQELDDEIRPGQAGKNISKARNDKPEQKREEKDRVQQQPSAIHINMSSGHNSSNHHNSNPLPQPIFPPQPTQSYPVPPPIVSQEVQPTVLHAHPPPAISIPAVHYIQPNPAPGNNDFYQIYNPPQNPISGLNARSCLLLLIGLIKTLGGITMVILGIIQLIYYSRSTLFYCSSPNTYYLGQCCTYNASTHTYSNCKQPYDSFSLTLGINLLCIGTFTAIVGIALLVKSYRVYQDNNHVIFCQECC